MAAEVKNIILNLERNYCIIASNSGKNILHFNDCNNVTLLAGLRYRNAFFIISRNYDFTKYFEGGKS